MAKAIAIPYDMNKKHLVMMMFFIFGLLSIFGCGGGGGDDKGGNNPIVCTAPFVPNSAGTACICPSGTHQDGSTCVANTTPDTTPPTVFITAPANNATVSGNLTLTASVVDDRGVAEVNLVVDGSQTGNTFTEGPANVFTTNVNTTSLGNSSHTLKVCAIDTSSNTSCSSDLSVTVNNVPAGDTIPPTVSITSPTNGSTIRGTVTVTANASDNDRIGYVLLYVNNNNTGSMYQSSPGVFTGTYGTGYLSYGNITIKVCAMDYSSNTTCTSDIVVTVDNR